MVFIYRIILSLFFLASGFSDEIQVIDGISGKPIPFVKIEFIENNSQIITNEFGRFLISSDDKFQVGKPGYHSKNIIPPFPNQIKLFPIIFQHEEIHVSDSLINPHFELQHPLNIQKIENQIISSINIINIFNELPGMITKSYGGIGGVKTLSLNGGQGDRIQVLFNGISINNEQSGNADISQIPVGLLNTIQFIPIGSSSRFGNSAMSGIVNINSGFEPKFKFESGIFKDGFSINYSNSFTKNSTLIGINSGVLNVSQNIDWTEKGDYNPVVISHKQYDWFRSELNQKYISPWFNFNGKKFNLSGSGLITENKRIHSGKIYGPHYHPEIQDGLNLFGLSYKKDNLKSNFSYKGQWINYKTDSPYTPIINASHQLKIYKIDNEILLSSFSFFNKNILTKSLSNSTNPADTSSFQSHLGFTFRNFNNWINFHLTCRTVFESKIKPIHSYELILNRYIGNNFQFSGIYSRNFKKPNFNDLYWKPFGNENLQTEFSDNFYLNLSINYKKINIDFLSHYINYKNMIIWLPKPGNQDYWSPENIQSTTSSGHSFKLNIKELNNFNSTISISNNSTINENTKSQIAYSPEWILNWKSDYQYSKLKFGFSFNYQTERFINYSSYDGNSLRTIPAYSILNTSITYNFEIINYISSLGFLINNIMNTRFQSVYGYPEPGQSFEFQLTINKRKQ